MQKQFVFAIAIVAAMVGIESPARATLIDITTPGNLLALLPVSDLAASTISGVASGLTGAVNNLVGTANQDDGQVFADTDTDERFVVTGFNSQIREIRFFSSQNDLIRLPPSLTIFYSTLSTTSINSSDSNYTGANGGVLLPTMTLTSASFNHPIADSTNAYIDLSVNAPAGTKSLLFDLGNANGVGDRISEIQAFAVPEPGSLPAIAIVAGVAALRLRRRMSRKTC